MAFRSCGLRQWRIRAQPGWQDMTSWGMGSNPGNGRKRGLSHPLLLGIAHHSTSSSRRSGERRSFIPYTWRPHFIHSIHAIALLFYPSLDALFTPPRSTQKGHPTRSCLHPTAHRFFRLSITSSPAGAQRYSSHSIVVLPLSKSRHRERQ